MILVATVIALGDFEVRVSAATLGAVVVIEVAGCGWTDEDKKRSPNVRCPCTAGATPLITVISNNKTTTKAICFQISADFMKFLICLSADKC
jgi:hypothetical protein